MRLAIQTNKCTLLYFAVSVISNFMFKSSDIMKQLGGALKDADMNTLFLKYDLNNNNHFCYNDFLRQFVLVMQPQREATSLLNRKKADPPKVSVSFPPFDEDTLLLKMCRLYMKFVFEWYEMVLFQSQKWCNSFFYGGGGTSIVMMK